MYFRRKQSQGRIYLQIVESQRPGAQVRQRVTATLGRLDAEARITMRTKSARPSVARVGLAVCVVLAVSLHVAAQPAGSPPNGVPFLIRFGGTVRGLKVGAPVEIRGIRIGDVRSIGLEYVPDTNSFVVPVEIALQPSLFPSGGPTPPPRTSEEIYAAADALVQHGLRAQLMSTQLIGGDAVIALDVQPNAAPARLDRSGALPVLPAGASPREVVAEQLRPLIEKIANAPVDKMIADLQESMAALKELITGPELRGALDELRAASVELREAAARFGTKSDALVDNLNQTVRSATRVIDRSGQMLATLDYQLGDRSPLLADIRGLLQQLEDAARSMRLMAEYLERNPNALLTGKSSRTTDDDTPVGSDRGSAVRVVNRLRFPGDEGVRPVVDDRGWRNRRRAIPWRPVGLRRQAHCRRIFRPHANGDANR
jgi:paraquat-inducible protein B